MTSPFLAFCAGVIITSAVTASPAVRPSPGYRLEHEADIARIEPGPHRGAGTSTAYPFFHSESALEMVFRKRALHPKASIGYHFQDRNEIYFILSGAGDMSVNGQTFPVSAGNAILTYAGNWHGLSATGTDSLVLLINYPNK